MKKERLSEIADIVSGISAPKSFINKNEKNAVPFIRAGSLEQLCAGKDEIIEYLDGAKFKKVPKDTVIFAKSGMSSMKNRIYTTRKDSIIVGHLVGIICKERVYSKYIEYYFKYNKPSKLIKNDSYPSIKIEDIKNIEIVLPEKEEQIKIVKTLSLIEDIINIKINQIDKLDKLIEAKFFDMFGDVKKNDKEWNYTTLGKECFLNPKKSELKNIDEDIEISFVAMPSVSEKGQIDTSVIKKYNDVKKGFTYFAENDVLFAKITPCMENGKGAVAIGLKNKIGFGSTEFHVLRPKENINSLWLYTLTAMKSFRAEAERKMTGSAGQKRVPISFFENYNLGLPPIELQNKFAECVRLIDEQKIICKKILDKLYELKEAKLQEYFGGVVNE